MVADGHKKKNQISSNFLFVVLVLVSDVDEAGVSHPRECPRLRRKLDAILAWRRLCNAGAAG